ncbi:hypothetical protein KP509_29G070800 [Ceratopteris richardii]|uniref:Pentatricopeptide repeat-containing protein n=1 Tax=Ceratopteris richardii TaxID=49495 RepID=A0A8T2R7U8_CERRI|nr:hypothetical protein KP509_29G070800 [Ceratopteris richardii]
MVMICAEGPNLLVRHLHSQHEQFNPSWFQEELKGDIHFPEIEEHTSFRLEKEVQKDLKIFREERTSIKFMNTISDFKDDTCAAISFAESLKVCAKNNDLQRGTELHAKILKTALLETNVIVGSALVSMYAKCGALWKAQEVFNELSDINVVSWNALIGGYAQCGCSESALRCYKQMQFEGFSPDAVTFVCTLNACGSMKDSEKGEEIHAQVIKDSLLGNVFVGNALLDMYAKCGLLTKAQRVFDELPVRDTISWNALIFGYAQHGYSKEALFSFSQMQTEQFSPNDVTFISLLKACASTGDLDVGRWIHAQIVKMGITEHNTLAAYALLDMYAKCGLFCDALAIFAKLADCDVVAWNILVSAYVQHEYGEWALKLFDQMQLDGFSPDTVTFACALKACGIRGMANKGQCIHAQIIKSGLPENDLFVGTALVDMYGKCGLLSKCQKAFDDIIIRDAVTWNSLIDGYAQHAHITEALICYEEMQNESILPSPITFTSIVKACGTVGAACKGQSIHSDIVKYGAAENNTILATALVDMYASCGMLSDAHYVFGKISSQDVVSWSALLAGYAQFGQDKLLLNLYCEMLSQGKLPNPIICSIVLNTYRHIGLLDEGQLFFEMFSMYYGIYPTIEHFACIVDLFGRAGHIEMVLALVQEIPLAANLMLWQTVLSAFQKWESTKLGRWAFEHALELDNENPKTYVSFRNIHAVQQEQFRGNNVMNF